METKYKAGRAPSKKKLTKKPTRKIADIKAEKKAAKQQERKETAKPKKVTAKTPKAADFKIKKFEEITEHLINALDSEVIPWNRPYVVNMPQNVFTGREYRGFNFFLLDMLQSMGHPMASELNCYATMKQINDHGGRVKKGAKALPVTFMKRAIYKKEYETENGEIETEEKISFLMKSYKVFPIEATTGIEWDQFIDAQDFDHSENEDVSEKINKIMAAIGLTFKNGNCIPHYAPSADYIKMPKVNKFKSVDEYYSTLLHELIHATGHKSRTGRFATYKNFSFDSNKHEYSFEELVAEMGAAMLCSFFKIPSHKTLENSAAYIQGWAKVLKKDKKMAYMAASKAQQAVDYIINALEKSGAQPEAA